jgi:hypothetical protein
MQLLTGENNNRLDHLPGEVGLPDHAGWSKLLIHPADSCVILQLQLFGQLLPQQGGAVQFWVLLSGSGDQFCGPLPFLLWGVAYHLLALSLHCLYCVCLLIVHR